MAGEELEQQQDRRLSRGGVALAWLWVLVLAGLGATAAALQFLGPLPPSPAPQRAAATASPAGAAPAAPARDGIAVPGPIPALEESSGDGGATLPRIGAGGLMPMRAYAARFDAADPRPKVAVLLTGLGMAQSDSERAIDDLPAAVSLAFSPYAVDPGALEAAARANGHELLVSLPMEPAGYPLNDAGNEALLTGASAGQNQRRLLRALSACRGCVGVTAAMGGLMGERFAASPEMPPVLHELASRGLLYVAPRPLAALPGADPATTAPGERTADVILDEPPDSGAVASQLAALEKIAHDRGAAVGIAGPPNPATVGQLAAWAKSLAARGLALVPVSALVPPLPAPAKPAKS